MDTRRHATGHPFGPSAGSATEIGRLLAHLQQRLVELDRLHHEISQDAQALAHAAADAPEIRDDDAGSRSVYSVRAAATELGVSVSMLHKLLKQRRLGHLKVGARTLITAEHLAQFRQAAEVPRPVTAPETSPQQALTMTPGTSPAHQEPTTRTAANASAAAS